MLRLCFKRAERYDAVGRVSINKGRRDAKRRANKASGSTPTAAGTGVGASAGCRGLNLGPTTGGSESENETGDGRACSRDRGVFSALEDADWLFKLAFPMNRALVGDSLNSVVGV